MIHHFSNQRRAQRVLNHLSSNRKLKLRNLLPWLLCFLFLFSSGGFFASLEFSGVNVGNRVNASATVRDTQSLLGAGESGCTDADFTPAVTSPEGVGSLPVHSAVGDFNLDGKLDLATANFNDHSVTILLGNGMGDFTQPATSPEIVGGDPFWVAVGDFNSDGKPDLAVADVSESNSVKILLGNGMGDFTQPATSPEVAGAAPISVAVGDFNADGKADLAVVNQDSDNVTILLGNGTGDFTPAPSSPESVGDTPQTVVIGDFNSDGKLDLATANYVTNNVTILLGDGTGNFTQPATSPEAVGVNPEEVAVGDFNSDGKPDLAVANNGSNTVTILLGNGLGDFTQPATSPEAAGDGSNSVTVGDFNLDGKLDLATANYFASTATILLGDGTGNFTPSAASPEAVGSNPESVRTGDFNADGRPDLVTTNNLSHNVTILLNTCTARPCPTNFTPAPTSPEPLGAVATKVVAGDFNLDSKPDLAAIYSNTVAILLGNATGDFTPAPSISGDSATAIAVGDFNLDGKPDLALTIDINVKIFLGDGTGHFTPVATNSQTDLNPQSIAVGDFNRDGKPDLATANFSSSANNVTILLGDGTGHFTQPATSPEAVGENPQSVVVGDFNSDGKLDLATANAIGDNMTILLGEGNGNFTALIPFQHVGDQPGGMSVADFNLDGRLDLATANGNTNNMTILLGVGNGTFANTSTPATGSNPVSTAVGDFNFDGKPDLVVANQGSNNLTILLGDGTGHFTQPATSPEAAANNPKSVIVGDFDRDGRPDLATVTGGSNNLTILLATCNTPPTIATQPVSQVKDTTSGNLPIATVNDVDQSEDTLVVTISPDGSTFSGTATLNGVTVSNIAVNSQGNVTATVAATCTATNASFTLKVTDAAGAVAAATLAVTVTPEMQAPTITCPANISMMTVSSCEIVNYPAPMASDNCTLPANAVVCTPPSGFCFSPGTTTVNCTVTDASQNQANCSFTVTITQCTIQCQANITKDTDPNQCQAVVNYATPTTTGNCGTVTCTPPSGSPFQKGVTTVNCTTQSGPSCSFTVTVSDAQPPTITCPANKTQNNDSNQCGAAVTYANATATDNCSGVGTPTCSPASGSFFSTGTTTVICTVKDGANLTASCSFTITVNDTQPPTITCPANITRGTDANQCQAVVNYPAPTITDNCTPPASGKQQVAGGSGFTPICTPPSGSAFPKGVTTVNCTVVDGANNQSSCSFTITVNDTQNPTISCPANIIRSTDANSCSAVVTFATTASDNCPGVGVVCTPPSGSTFPKGVTTVSCTATDSSSRTASCSFTVTVADTQPPVIACPANLTAVTATVNDACTVVNFTLTTNDNCSGTTIVCNPPSGTCFPVGVTTTTCTATDQSGNTSTCSFMVSVFNARLQDDSGACSNTVLFNTLTGDYRWCCGGTIFTGQGTVTRQGSTFKLEHNVSDRRVVINLGAGNSTPSGTATFQSLTSTTKCMITDRDIRNNTCVCGG
jgi:hypothetical protein